MAERQKKIPRKYFQVNDLGLGDRIVVEKGLLRAAITKPLNEWLDARNELAETKNKIFETENDISFRQSVIRLEITSSAKLKEQMAILSKEIKEKSGYSAEDIVAREEEILERTKSKNKSKRQKV